MLIQCIRKRTLWSLCPKIHSKTFPAWKYMLHPFMGKINKVKFFYKTDDKIRWRNAISLNIHKVCEIESQTGRKIPKYFYLFESFQLLGFENSF